MPVVFFLNRLRPEQLATLVSAIRTILNKSIHSGGPTLRDYRNVSNQPGQFARQLLAYGRASKPCNRCQTPLKSTQISARTTVFRLGQIPLLYLAISSSVEPPTG